MGWCSLLLIVGLTALVAATASFAASCEQLKESVHNAYRDVSRYAARDGGVARIGMTRVERVRRMFRAAGCDDSRP
jgi:hypothetical protein